MKRRKRYNAVRSLIFLLFIHQIRAWTASPAIYTYYNRQKSHVGSVTSSVAIDSARTYSLLYPLASWQWTVSPYTITRCQERLKSRSRGLRKACAATPRQLGLTRTHLECHNNVTAEERLGPAASMKTGRGNGDTKKGGPKKAGVKLQSVDFTTALVLSHELAQTVVPSRVENAFQYDSFNLVLGLRTLEGNLWLHICWHPQGARCHLSQPPPREREQKAYTFSQTLRSLIRGLTIVAVRVARPFERVVSLDLAARLEQPSTHRLYVEIMSSRSNVVLVAVDTSGVETIAACAYQVSPTKSIRPLSTGQSYDLPPAIAARRPSSDESLDEFIEGVTRVPTVQLKKALVEIYKGTSPALVRVMASCVPGITSTTKVGDISQDQWTSLYSGPWQRWLELIGDGMTTLEGTKDDDATNDTGEIQKKPSVRRAWLAQDGLSYYPTTLRAEDTCSEGDDDGNDGCALGGLDGLDGRHEYLFDSLQGVMEKYYRSTQNNDEFDSLRRRCVARLTGTLVKLRERASEFEQQLAAAQDNKIAELNRRGDLLVTYGHTWEQGQREVVCVDFDTGETILLPLSPDNTPVEEAQEAFRQAKKLKRSAAVIQALLDQVLYAEGIELALDQLRGLDARSTSGSIAASREDLSVLRGISEELGLQGGAEAAQRFASAFGVRQMQANGAIFGGGGGATAGGKSGRKSVAKGKKVRGKGKGGGNAQRSKNGAGGAAGKASRKYSSTIGLLELCRQQGSPVVLVGRNNLQNDRITFSVARAHELWFHARGVAGAHVLLRLQPGQEVEDEDLAFAADIAAYFSKGRQSKSIPVDYITPKAIKKLGGGGPGMVKYEGARVIWGEPGRVEALIDEAMRSRDEAAR